MLKLTILALAAVCMLAATTNAAVAHANPSEVPGHEGKCWDEGANLELSAGEKGTSHATCTQITCHQDLSMDFFSCPAFQPGKGCRAVAGDLTKDYPDCCPTQEC